MPRNMSPGASRQAAKFANDKPASPSASDAGPPQGAAPKSAAQLRVTISAASEFGTGINSATDAINQKIGRELIAPSGLLNDFLKDRDSELRALLDAYLKQNDLT